MMTSRRTRRFWWTLLAGTLVTSLVFPVGVGAQTEDATATPVVTEATPTPTPTAGCQENAGDAEQLDGVTVQEQLQDAWTYNGAGNGPRNIVKLHNRRSGQLRVRGNVQLNRILGDTVDPFNYGIAYNACGAGAATFAVALQVNLYREGASYVAPENYAYAVNYGCERCAALAYAVQLAYPVADPQVVPPEVRELVSALDRELQAIHAAQRDLTLGQAHLRVKAVVDRFRAEIPAQFQEAEHSAPAAA